MSRGSAIGQIERLRAYAAHLQKRCVIGVGLKVPILISVRSSRQLFGLRLIRANGDELGVSPNYWLVLGGDVFVTHCLELDRLGSSNSGA